MQENPVTEAIVSGNALIQHNKVNKTPEQINYVQRTKWMDSSDLTTKQEPQSLFVFSVWEVTA